MSSNKLIQDLIFFYVKENYKKFLDENKMEKIHDSKIMDVIDSIYSDRKKHLKDFLKDSLKKIQKENYIGDLVLENICVDIFNDDELCKHRIYTEIKLFQDNKS